MSDIQLGKWALNSVVNVDALELLRGLPDNSVHCCVTSPPYFGLRDYGVDGQLGREATPAKYVAALVKIFAELHRVLRDDGTFWLNLGDTYTGGGRGGNPPLPRHWKQGTNTGSLIATRTDVEGLPPKSLVGIPWRVAFALQDAGWILRSDIVWDKGNPMPESVTDRPTKAHEYIFLFSKCGKYFYDADAIKTPVQKSSIKRQGRAVSDKHKNHSGAPGQTPHSMFRARPHAKQDGTGNRRYTGFNERYEGQATPMANARSVWRIHPKGFKGAHFATFPPELAERMILAGCSEGGLVLDPFFGAGTVGLVAQRLGRNWLGSDVNADYCELARARIAGRFAEYQAQQAGEPFTAYMFSGPQS